MLPCFLIDIESVLCLTLNCVYISETYTALLAEGPKVRQALSTADGDLQFLMDIVTQMFTPNTLTKPPQSDNYGAKIMWTQFLHVSVRAFLL